MVIASGPSRLRALLGRVGPQIPVKVYTSGDEAEFFLNDKSLGRKKKGEFEYRLRWDDVTYQPGELKVVADKDGPMVPRSMNQIHFAISGPGEIVATDNGDPTDMTAFPAKDRKAFNGLALEIVRAKAGQTGAIVVTAASDHLGTTQTTILAK